MPKIDLDAARAARRAAAPTETPTMSFGGRDFALPDELPFGVFTILAELREADADSSPALVVALIKMLIGDEADAFLELNPSMADIEVLMAELMKQYHDEDEAGESSASAASS